MSTHQTPLTAHYAEMTVASVDEWKTDVERSGWAAECCGWHVRLMKWQVEAHH